MTSRIEPGIGERFSIGIVSPYAFGAISGGATGHAGGVERQTALTARWLAARGHMVSLLVWDEGQADEVRIDGVRVIKMCRLEDGLPGLRFLHPRWTSLRAALARADADVYYHNCAEYVTGQIALWCRRRGRAFVYSVASDPECDPALPALRQARARALFRFGLRHADRIIVQTRRQSRLLREGWQLESTVLPMPCPGPAALAPREFPAGRARLIWVGRISPEKRPEWLLDLAAALPEIDVDVVGPSSERDVATAQAFLERAASVSNLHIRGRVARERMPEVYRDAAGLVCTSEYEGFPNTFLEAWSHGVPVFSTIDPDDLIADRGLGAVAGGTTALARSIRAALGSPDDWRRMSENARTYYASRHMVEAALPAFESIFAASALQARARGGSRGRMVEGDEMKTART